ncbi:proline--tRNA ligase [Candidatus Woesearchaeota archaeon]|nr:proline--tRNA ligase [Candidatus Woesearchaeota archaeon]
MAKEEKKNIGITVKRDEDFSEWYQQVIIKGELAEYSKVSGCMVFRPNSWFVWEQVRGECDKRFKKLGVQNAAFPLFIPEGLIKKEGEFIADFAPLVAWVDYGGNSKLSERLAVRPTSEAIFYDHYKNWIRSHRDLPLKINQWANVVRWEFKHPVPFFRTREFFFNEGHTAFATEKESLAEQDEIMDVYEDILVNYMAVPSLRGRKSDKEKFAGAVFSSSFEHYLPNGKAIQGPAFHHDGQNFAKAYELTFTDVDEKESFVWQNTWAISTRNIGIMAAIHSDDKGLVIPPKMARIQVALVPIFNDKNKDEVLAKANELKKKLEKSFRVHVDDRAEYSPGWKFNEWELKGVPIRIELGPKDIAAKQAVLVRRDSGKKMNVNISDIAKTVEKQMDAMHDDLYKKAEKLLKDNIVRADSWDAFI